MLGQEYYRKKNYNAALEAFSAVSPYLYPYLVSINIKSRGYLPT